ncbi:MAG: hypothetical protein AAB403_12575 [Planctomycetota bacterium]
MPFGEQDAARPVGAVLTFEEKQTPFLLDLSSLLYDLELLHDLGVMLWYERYARLSFSRYFWYRNGRPLRPEHRLRARRVELRSPLLLEIIFGTAAAAWTFTQMAEKVSNWRVNRAKLRLEVEKLEAERNVKLYEEETARVRLETAMREREAVEIVSAIARRLEVNPIRLIDIEIQIPREE